MTSELPLVGATVTEATPTGVAPVRSHRTPEQRGETGEAPGRHESHITMTLSKRK